ncbi:hypothetical protein PIB30_094844, partial [Stylosanthes scabra]|nr:hypothetical protein [Stylosanthes scabra]
ATLGADWACFGAWITPRPRRGVVRARQISASLFQGVFGAQTNCQPWTIIYRREAPDVNFQTRLELHRLDLCDSTYPHFSA